MSWKNKVTTKSSQPNLFLLLLNTLTREQIGPKSVVLALQGGRNLELSWTSQASTWHKPRVTEASVIFIGFISESFRSLKPEIWFGFTKPKKNVITFLLCRAWSIKLRSRNVCASRKLNFQRDNENFFEVSLTPLPQAQLSLSYSWELLTQMLPCSWSPSKTFSTKERTLFTIPSLKDF